MTLKPVQYTHAHMVEYNQPPKLSNVPEKLWLSSFTSTRSVVLTISNPQLDFPLVWHACDSSSPEVMVQCLEPTTTNSVTATLRLATSAVGKTHNVRFQIANLGPAPNASEVFEIPVSIEPVCLTPWGQTIENGITVTAFNQSSVAFNDECKPSDITCVNGSISGTGKFPTCVRRTPIACQLPWGETLEHATSRVAFGYATVPFGSTCPQEARTCSDGVLSGTAQFQNCSIQSAANCKTPWGSHVPHGNTVVAFNSATVDFGRTCDAQIRMCNNGILTGNASIQNCAPSPPRNCFTPWGASIVHGTSIDAYSRANVPFGQSCNVGGVLERRVCDNGLLLGSFSFRTCSTLGP
jgi:hypothetical protein